MCLNFCGFLSNFSSFYYSEEIQGEILFVLYKIAFLVNANEDNDFSEVLDANCAKLLVLSLEALMKTQSDDVRLNCIGWSVV